MPNPSLLHPDQALELVLAALPRPRLESVALDQAVGRVLVAELSNKLDQPPFDRATMDGFALALAALPPQASRFKVVGTAAAGSPLHPALGPGECLRIMTGAALPPGATMVHRVERTAALHEGGLEGEWISLTQVEDGPNVNLKGANLKAGAPLIGPRRLRPQDLGVLASSGYGQVEVGRRPIVGILSTGDELKAAGEALGPTSIYDTNGPSLAALAREAGAQVRVFGIVRDEPSCLEAALVQGLGECDILLSSGGVSMGDFDYLPGLLAELGVERIFHKLAMKPGKPLWFGRRSADLGRLEGGSPTLVFALPGNPVSSFVGFELFVRPAIAAWQGLDPRPQLLRTCLGEAVERKDTERLEYLPVKIEAPEAGEGTHKALPVPYSGSSMVQALAWADGLLRLDIGEARLEKGCLVDVRLLRA